MVSTSGATIATLSNSMRPREGNSPMIADSMVVLPAPLGPITVTIWPSPTVMLASVSASTLP